MALIHGGDIYRNHVKLDFSVNINPLGMPDIVRSALMEAVEKCSSYPDIQAAQLKKAVSDKLSVPQEYLLFGNGASELFMAIVHALRPKKVLIPVPSFYGYEYAAKAAGSEIIYLPMKAEEDFTYGDALLTALTEEIDLLFIADPNNPTGRRMSPQYQQKLLKLCEKKKITVVLDECFAEFCENKEFALARIGQYQQLLIVRAFTKFYAIPGVRLGYLISSNQSYVEQIESHLPEWNLSVFAQAAGAACMKLTSYEAKTVELIRTERRFLEEGLREYGFRVISGDADFILFYSEYELYRLLLEQGILIRDCENYRGLSKGYYRIAVKKREENQKLLRAIGEIIEQNRTFTSGRN